MSTGAQIKFDIYNLNDAYALVSHMHARSYDLRPLNEAIAQTMMQSTQDRFDQQRAPDGTPWVPSKAAQKEKRKTLLDTHHFRDTTFSAEATDDEAVWGTNAVQAAIFQFGGTIKRKARKGSVRLRQNADGSLMRQKNHSRLAVFARRSHRRAKTVAFESGAYNIKVVARPYLGLSSQDVSTIYDLAMDHLAPGGA